jgi:leucyl aminopeptidase (aminopeptidase T)
MELDKALEPISEWCWIEMGKVGKKIVEEFFPIQTGENVVVTADTMSDWRAVKETVKAIYALGATPTLIIHPTTEVATSDPPPPVTAALQACDAWIEFNDSYLLYSNAWKKAMEAGVRFFTLGGDVDSLVRMIGRVDYDVLDKLGSKLIELSNKAAEIHVTSGLGADITIGVHAQTSMAHHVRKAGRQGGRRFEGKGSTQVPPGQSTFGHVPGSAEGTLVFDGAVYPPVEIGVLREPVTLEISKGKITKITGGQEARAFERWLANWNHPAMYEIAHCTYGFNPGVKRCKGEIGHDERVFGCMEFGIGPAWADAPAHTDGVILRPSVWADDVQLEEEGKYVHPELVELSRQLGVAGY